MPSETTVAKLGAKIVPMKATGHEKQRILVCLAVKILFIWGGLAHLNEICMLLMILYKFIFAFKWTVGQPTWMRSERSVDGIRVRAGSRGRAGN